MLKNFLLPLLAAILIGGITYLAANYFEAGLFDAMLLGIFSFGALLTLYNHFRINFSKTYSLQRFRDLHELEQSIENRLNTLEDKIGISNQSREIEGRLKALEEGSSTNLPEENLHLDEKDDVLEFKHSENRNFASQSHENVIMLGSAKSRRIVEERRSIIEEGDESLPNGMNLENHFRLFLHPIFELPEKEMTALTAFSGLYDESTEKRHIFRQNGLTLSPRTLQAIVIKSIDAVAETMKLMRKNKERVPLTLDITAAIIGTDETFKTVLRKLKRDSIFRKMFIAQINFKDYMRFSKAQKARFSTLRELELELCIGNCSGFRDTLAIVEKGIFQNISIPTANLMQFNDKKDEQLVESLVKLAEDHNVKIVATSVDQETHISVMLDNHINLVQGELLSKPILATISSEEKAAGS